MELKLSHNQAGIGDVPEDWEHKSIQSFSAFVTKGSTPTTYGYKWEDQGILFLRSECVSANGLDLTQSMFISKAAHAALIRGEVRSGDILITITGNVGRVVLLGADFGAANINQHIARIRVNDPNVFADYVYQVLSQPRVRNYYASITTGQAYPQISLKQVRETRVPLPSLGEQKAIAGVLKDVDALLATLEELIAKKRDLKQAAMQQLLTGQTRLQGYDGEWHIKRLGDIAEVVMGQSPASSSYNQNGDGAPLINGPTEFTDKHPIKLQWTSQPTKFCEKGDLLLCVRGSSTGRINISDDVYCIGRGIAAIRAKSDSDTSFVTFQVERTIQSILALTTGSTFPNIDGKSIRGITLGIPKLAEQTAIVAVLADMNAEIEALEARHDKTRALKQGMMQELLTGRVRLV